MQKKERGGRCHGRKHHAPQGNEREWLEKSALVRALEACGT